MKIFKVQNIHKVVPTTLGVAIISMMTCLTIVAWTEPSNNAPIDNVKAPINTSNAAQGKLGNLGIGTTYPGAKLDVRGGSALFTNSDWIASSNGSGLLINNDASGNTYTRLSAISSGGAAWNNLVLQSGGGNVGIGTVSPEYRLDVNGTVGLRSDFTLAGSNRWIFHTPDDGRTTMYIAPWSGSDYLWGTLTLQQNGNMGLGTANPGYKLAVVGSANISRDGTSECCSSGDFSLSLAENTQTTGKKAGIQFHNGGAAEGQLRLDTGTNGRELKAYSYQDDMDLHATGYVQGDKGLCIGNDCCSSWAECTGGGSDPFVPVSGCNDPLPDNNKKIFVTSTTYNVELVHTPNFTYTTANADNACQTRAAAAGLSGTYLALMYETVLSQLNNCNLITVLRYPTDVLPAAALWNGQKISGTNNCEWHLVATNGSDMFSVNPDGNYLQNPIKYNEFGTLTDTRVFTNFQPTGSGGYDRMNTCLQNSTCNYITGGATRGCFYGYSTSKDINWAGAYSPLNAMSLCTTPCIDASSQKALYCVQQ